MMIMMGSLCVMRWVRTTKIFFCANPMSVKERIESFILSIWPDEEFFTSCLVLLTNTQKNVLEIHHFNHQREARVSTIILHNNITNPTPSFSHLLVKSSFHSFTFDVLLSDGALRESTEGYVDIHFWVSALFFRHYPPQRARKFAVVLSTNVDLIKKLFACKKKTFCVVRGNAWLSRHEKMGLVEVIKSLNEWERYKKSWKTLRILILCLMELVFFVFAYSSIEIKVKRSKELRCRWKLNTFLFRKFSFVYHHHH